MVWKNTEDSRKPRTVGPMKTIFHRIDENRHFEFVRLLKVSGVVQTFVETLRLAKAGDGFACGPLITGMGLSDVNRDEANAVRRVRTKELAERQIRIDRSRRTCATDFIRSTPARNGGQVVEPARMTNG